MTFNYEVASAKAIELRRHAFDLASFDVWASTASSVSRRPARGETSVRPPAGALASVRVSHHPADPVREGVVVSWQSGVY